QLFADLQTQFEAEKLQLSEMHLSERRAWELKLSNGIILDIGRKALSERVTKFINIYPILVNDDPAPIERVDLRYDTGMAVTRMPIVAQDESGKP
ncbi:MAG: cell division protein FtsQ/DivIB, partial [Gammaproteobacteria bacterium]